MLDFQKRKEKAEDISLTLLFRWTALTLISLILDGVGGVVFENCG